MIHLEPGHRIVAETVAARLHSAPDKREAVDVRCSDFGAQYYVSVQPEEKHILRVSLWLRCFEEIVDAVGQGWLQDFYAGMVEAPQAGYKLTLAINLDSLPADMDAKGTHCALGLRPPSSLPHRLMQDLPAHCCKLSLRPLCRRFGAQARLSQA